MLILINCSFQNCLINESDDILIFITCFDPGDNTIFFYEFFSNKIVADPTPPIKKTLEDEKININNNNNINNNTNNNPTSSITFVFNNEKSGVEMPAHEIKTGNNFGNFNSNILKDDKFYKKELTNHFCTIWKKIKDLSELESNYYASESVKNKFFQRPYISKYLFPESLGKAKVASTFPLPQCLSRYEKVSLNIFFHESVTPFCKEIKPIIYQKEVGLFYVVDTLIKDCIIFLKKNLENYQNYNNINKNFNYSNSYINNQNADETFNDNLNTNFNNSNLPNKNISKQEKKINNSSSSNPTKDLSTRDVKEEKKDFLQIFFNKLENPNNKFILKLSLLEEYIYGDIPISFNVKIRRKIREREKVNLVLMCLDESEIKPNISYFPMLIRVAKRQSYHYDDLMKYYIAKNNLKYNDKINDKSIIFMFKTEVDNQENLDHYSKKNYKRREYLKRYCESGEADYPFMLYVKSINNISAIINHIWSTNYEFPGIILFNFKKKKRIKKNFFETIAKKFIFCLKKAEKDKEENQQNHEAMMNKKRELDYHAEKKLINQLNFMQFLKNPSAENQITFNLKTKIQAFFKTRSLKEYFKGLSKKNSEDNIHSRSNSNNKNKFNFYNRETETYISPFLKIKEYIDFLPLHIILETTLVYGTQKIRSFKSKGCLIKDDVIINEKINFSQYKHEKEKSHSMNNEYEFLYVSYFIFKL